MHSARSRQFLSDFSITKTTEDAAEFDVKKYERTLRSEGHEEGIQFTLEILQESNLPRDYAKTKLKEKYSMSEDEAEKKLLQYWK